MGIMDKIRGMLGGDSVSGFTPDDDDDDDEEDTNEPVYRDTRAPTEAEALAAFDRLSDADDSRGEADYR